jgi:hypothetical protein
MRSDVGVARLAGRAYKLELGGQKTCDNFSIRQANVNQVAGLQVWRQGGGQYPNNGVARKIGEIVKLARYLACTVARFKSGHGPSFRRGAFMLSQRSEVATDYVTITLN